MIGDLLDWLIGSEEVTGPYVSAAGLSWRFVSRRFERKLNAALAKGYKKPNCCMVADEHGYWPVNRLRLSVWLDPPESPK